MPVFDFNSTPVPDAHPECTYTAFYSNDSETAPEKPILVLDTMNAAGITIPVVFLQTLPSAPPLNSRKRTA